MGYLQSARQRLASAAHLARKHARTAGKVALGAAAAAVVVAGAVQADRAVANEVRKRVNDAPLVGAYGRKRSQIFGEKQICAVFEMRK